MASVPWKLLRSAPLAATLAFFCHAFVIQLLRPLNQDVGWFFFVAKSLVAGDRQYGDFSDENPPLILWLYAMPAWVANVFDISGIVCLRLFVLLVAALSVYLSNRLLRRLLEPDRTLCRQILICAVSYLLTVFPETFFGQREHFIAMCLMPYAVSVAVRLCRTGRAPLPALLAIGVGLGAGLAVSLKPVYLPAVLAPEILLLWKERSLSPLIRREMWLFPIVGVSYLLAVQIFAPEYFEVTVPLALDCYSAYQEPLAVVFGLEIPAYLLASFILARLGTGKADRPLGALANVLVLSGSGCYLAYLMGLTSWSYHLLPVWVAIFTLVAIAVLGALQRLVARLDVEVPPTSHRLRVVSGAILLAVVGLVLVDRPALYSSAQVLLQDGDYLTPRSTRNRDLLRFQEFVLANTSSKRSVHILSPLIKPAFPLVNHAGLNWTSRFGSPWILPAAAYAKAGFPGADLDAARIEEIEDYFIRSTVDDMRRHEPELVLVEVGRNLPRFRGLPLDFLRLLARDPRFEALWGSYRKIGAVRYQGRNFAAYRRHGTPADF